jgi:pyruvate formate lyase activating enzyme
MNIGGLQPLTLSDFPGHVAAIVFTQGCNFCCPFCHNGALLASASPGRHLFPVPEVIKFLQVRADHLDGVVISGGEPTIQPGLRPFVRLLKDLGFLVKLDTNGSRPGVLRAILDEGLLDFVAMDVKGPWRVYDRVTGITAPIAAVRESIAIVSQSGIEHEFRTTLVDALLSRDDIQAIRQQVPAGSHHRLQRFEPQQALDHTLRCVSFGDTVR